MNQSESRAVILIVNNDKAARARFAAALSDHLEIIEAENGAKALAALKQKSLDLVVTDLKLPDLSGRELCHQIKNDPQGQLVPILVASLEKLTIDDRLGAIDAGADEFVFGPDADAVLPATARIALARGRIQRQLRESQLLYQRTVESLPIYIYSARVVGDRVMPEYYSPVVERITGYSPSEFMADPLFWLSIVHPDDRERLRTEMSKLQQSDHQISEYRIVRKDGQVRWLRDQLLVNFDAEGRTLSYFGAVDDITDRKEIEEQLAAANAQLREVSAVRARFTSQLVHDIRSPLTSILGTLELIAGEQTGQPLPVEMQRDVLLGAIKSAEQINNLVEDLLTVTKLEAHKYHLEKEAAHIGDIVQYAVSVMSGAATARQIRLETEIESGLPIMMMDESLITRAVINLLSNAIKFTPLGGLVRVEASTREGSVYVSVQDTGVGISAEELPQIFEMYWQGSGARKKSGMGLGLAFVRLVVAEHGGEISVETAEGKGSRFTFRLPITPVS